MGSRRAGAAAAVLEGPMSLQRREFLQLAAGAIALPACRRAPPRRLTRPDHPFAGRLSGGWRCRHCGTADGAVAERAHRPAGRGREQARCGDQPGDRAGAEISARRLHPPGRLRHPGGQRLALSQSGLQFHPRHGADRQHFPRRAGHGGQSRFSGEDDQGIHRLRQGQPRQDQHGFGRCRQPAARRGRTVPLHDRHRNGRTSRIVATHRG